MKKTILHHSSSNTLILCVGVNGSNYVGYAIRSDEDQEFGKFSNSWSDKFEEYEKELTNDELSKIETLIINHITNDETKTEYLNHFGISDRTFIHKEGNVIQLGYTACFEISEVYSLFYQSPTLSITFNNLTIIEIAVTQEVNFRQLFDYYTEYKNTKTKTTKVKD